MPTIQRLLRPALALALILTATAASARSSYLNAFKSRYPASTLGNSAPGGLYCGLCHPASGSSYNTRAFTLYGDAYRSHNRDFAAIEPLDSDGDGAANLAEITANTNPSDSASFPAQATPTPTPTPTATPTPNPVPVPAPASTPIWRGDYVVIGWNDLGMHCMGPDFSSLCILPPANNLWVQVIKRGDPPQLIGNDPAYELTYRFPNNSDSAGKINFWQYAKATFGSDLAPNVGLAGKGLSGTMDWNGTAWEAHFVPLTPFEDAAPSVLQPYQLAEVTLRSRATSVTLDQTTFVAPVSTEMHCDKCHPVEGGRGLPVYDSILATHDAEEGTHLLASKPVLCGSCHADNALGSKGNGEVPNLSRAIHGLHAEETNAGCYDCHPGPTTKCLRGAMYLQGYSCEDCHGTLEQLAQGLRNGRNPWVEEPRCATCHPDHSEDADGTVNLYRESTGHGGLYCTACHNSPHAILPTANERDGVQAMRLQGRVAPLGDCMICHTKSPSGPGPHGLTYKNAADPAAWRTMH